MRHAWSAWWLRVVKGGEELGGCAEGGGRPSSGGKAAEDG
jgi:hypothetical protein